MAKITLSQLETHLFHVADTLRGKMDVFGIKSLSELNTQQLTILCGLAFHLSERLSDDKR